MTRPLRTSLPSSRWPRHPLWAVVTSPSTLDHQHSRPPECHPPRRGRRTAAAAAPATIAAAAAAEATPATIAAAAAAAAVGRRSLHTWPRFGRLVRGRRLRRGTSEFLRGDGGLRHAALVGSGRAAALAHRTTQSRQDRGARLAARGMVRGPWDFLRPTRAARAALGAHIASIIRVV